MTEGEILYKSLTHYTNKHLSCHIFRYLVNALGVMLLEIKGKVMNVALETLGEEGLYRSKQLNRG